MRIIIKRAPSGVFFIYDKLDIDTSGTTHIIHIGSTPIAGTLDNFSNKPSFGLEAITTLDYVADNMLKGTGNEEEISCKCSEVPVASLSFYIIKKNPKERISISGYSPAAKNTA